MKRHYNNVKLIVSDRVYLYDGKTFMDQESIYEKLPLVKELLTYDKEYFYCLHFNVKLKIIAADLVSIGSLTNSIVHPREVLRAAVVNGAHSVMFIHNHPSGDPEPSIDDIEVTNRLCKACSILGIQAIDHIIVADTGFFSFKRKNLL